MVAKLARGLIALMSAECFTASIAFAFTGNWKMGAYWFLVGCVNAIVYTF